MGWHDHLELLTGDYLAITLVRSQLWARDHRVYVDYPNHHFTVDDFPDSEHGCDARNPTADEGIAKAILITRYGNATEAPSRDEEVVLTVRRSSNGQHVAVARSNASFDCLIPSNLADSSVENGFVLMVTTWEQRPVLRFANSSGVIHVC